MNNLRQHYLDYISEMVTHHHGKLAPRYRRPEQYAKLNLPTAKQTFAHLPTEMWDRVWVWSDLHFHHRNILKYAERPFNSMEEMEEALVTNFNQLVKPDDVSIWVGDVTFAKKDATANQLLARMNGYKILIIGNHDFDRKHKLRDLDFDETHLCYSINDGELDLIFTHFPLDNLPANTINIHGHQHIGGFPHWSETSNLHINVNCEYHEYKPVQLHTLAELSKSRLTSVENN